MAKLAAFDMDGTLLMPDHRLAAPRLRAAIGAGIDLNGVRVAWGPSSTGPL
ncbi:hypothetical protein [Klebsiella pneumoniae]|uniref:hypothetical protein n=1 Tax=Klebsiella pneumoniae TaxID=573 RepID=UPI00191814C7|nr:hypothetical protein [Klebsiella pneumoniae]MEE2370844.1 hypothetical protein [Klebsiella pneumoniae]UZI77552.1 hypothetical protein JMX00_25925 [Klebsiella pneumoniae]